MPFSPIGAVLSFCVFAADLGAHECPYTECSHAPREILHGGYIHMTFRKVFAFCGVVEIELPLSHVSWLDSM